ncbi:hypothetical protein [Klebsiella sp. BIGb0407]|uniref:hypothetical protein n=1 Tax=Klebsiella sp. BIGb0407 TaxID=2940603 RepID=UPI002169197D|nr:hypothetical protein [Klebsiella sp. BIGb0407]MCS3430983.1 hypothetical protein [Klebsiella sp. BIGb0407]
MDIKLSFDRYNDFYLDDSHLAHMVNGDEKNALKISVWQKIKDYFRADKQKDAHQTLYNLIHGAEGSDKLNAFNQLKSFASPEYQDFFKKEIHCNDVLFLIKNETIGQSSLQSLMNISEQTQLHTMQESEQKLFLEMLDTLKEKESQYSDSYSGFIRLKMSDEHCYELLDLYRPQEEVDFPGIELVDIGFLTPEEQKSLGFLNSRGGVRLHNQFSTMGYQNTASGVEFSMLHPSINYLLEVYSKSHSNGEPSTESNSTQLNDLNDTYQRYCFNKNETDQVLNKIYEAHGGTLNISFYGRSDNRMVISPHTEREYLFQSTHSLQDLSNSLDAIFHKWTTMDKIAS